jgi:hypothetical protein
VHLGLGHAGKLLAGVHADADVGDLAEGDDAFQALVLAVASNNDLVEGAPAGADGLLYRMKTVQNFHLPSLPLYKGAAACPAVEIRPELAASLVGTAAQEDGKSFLLSGLTHKLRRSRKIVVKKRLFIPKGRLN